MDEVDAAIATLLGLGLMTVDEAGRVTGSHGLSLIPSDHRVLFDVGVRFVWCAVDAVGIPAAMRLNAEVESHCFQCGLPVSLTMRNGKPHGQGRESLRIGLAVSGCSGKVIQDVCPMLNFFCSQGHADRWARKVEGAKVISILQAAEIGRRTWSDIANL
ncbi:MAG TPA: organomercurial lyase [Dehalococcoidia bacterium]|nr:organomercurial lyase [Dehalococcoidia bacterium]